MSASEIKASLEAIAERSGGQLTPEAVVDAARDPSSALHAHFTWDDAEAAHKRRLDEARTLIRSVKVIVRTEPFIVKAPQFIHDPSAGDAQGYISIGRLATDEDRAREAVVAEFGRASSALARARAIAVGLGLAEKIEEVEGQIHDLSEAAHQAAA